jgi:hypothetical protein
MRHFMMLGLFCLGLFGVATESGCYTEYSYRPACQAVWVPAHRSWGRWHPGHWRCM